MRPQTVEVSHDIAQDIINLQGTEIASLRRELDAARSRIASLEKTVVEGDESKVLCQELRILVTEVTNVRNLQEKVQKTTYTNESLRDERKNLQEQLKETKNQIDALKLQLSEELKDQKSLMMRIAQLETHKRDLSVGLLTADKDRARLQQELDQCKSVNEDLKAKVEQSNKVEQLVRELQSLVELVIAQNKAPKSHTSEREDLHVSLKCTQIAFAEASLRNDTISRELSEVCASRDALQKQIECCEVRNDVIQSELSEACMSRDALQEQLSLSESQYLTLTKESVLLRESCDSLQDEVDRCKASCASLRMQVFSDLGMTSQSMPESLPSCMAEIECISRQAKKMQDQILKEERENRRETQDLMQERISRLLDATTEQEISLRTAREERDKSQENAATLLTDMTVLLAEIAECRSALDTAKAQEQLIEAAVASPRPEAISDNLGHDAPAKDFPGESSDHSVVTEDALADSNQRVREAEPVQAVLPPLSLGNTLNSVETMFVPFATQAVSLAIIQKTLSAADVCITCAQDLVWVNCPDDAFFVKAAQCLAKENELKACRNKAMKRLQQQAKCELILHVSGAFYYVGTYNVGQQEKLSREEYDALPHPVQNTLISSSCHSASLQPELRAMYSTGRVTGLKYPLRRVRYNHALHARLLRLWPSSTDAGSESY
ncbi:hypothetical protein BKA93DRAFT_785148 [Sparassis latifolia]